MPASEPGAPAASDWDAALDGVLASIGARPGREGVARAFHAVRALAYRSGPDRTPQAALRTGRGACTAKHLLLRDLLRRLGETAEVEIVEGDFADGMPLLPSMPEELRRRIQAGGVTDFHCRVVWRAPEGPLRLDATWPDAQAAQGFPASIGWEGFGDTRPAIADAVVRANVEDVITQKEVLLSQLPEALRVSRKRFLLLLSEWLEEQP